jgi:hypothetical protein
MEVKEVKEERNRRSENLLANSADMKIKPKSLSPRLSDLKTS